VNPVLHRGNRHHNSVDVPMKPLPATARLLSALRAIRNWLGRRPPRQPAGAAPGIARPATDPLAGTFICLMLRDGTTRGGFRESADHGRD